ncbi:MAG: hypothetical protein HC886_01105 [Leptolyngbyaceae cyanobacterium SM1_1_3]|nr:hypothetical protein [Leptolyngbyaceae cyanobacterium SM1_1_3]NJN03849.1 hypothetical protein [Leptolyngbyaceae cyanobacterium RM1_1_2]NJO10019.1 hypothetical protein [Leptolyngbyaceae cyanobacterium SL_1_1]
MVSYTVDSKGEAQRILNSYLVANGGQVADASVWLADGEIHTTSYWPSASTNLAEETQIIYHPERN